MTEDRDKRLCANGNEFPLPYKHVCEDLTDKCSGYRLDMLSIQGCICVQTTRFHGTHSCHFKLFRVNQGWADVIKYNIRTKMAQSGIIWSLTCKSIISAIAVFGVAYRRSHITQPLSECFQNHVILNATLILHEISIVQQDYRSMSGLK